MGKERKENGIKKERKEDISNKKNKEMKRGRKRQPTPEFCIPVNDASFSSTTRDRTQALSWQSQVQSIALLTPVAVVYP